MSATKIAICMGSQSDWPTMKEAAAILDSLDVPCDIRIISAHRTPDRLAEFARTAEAQGFEIIIAGAGGAAHLPGMIAAQTHLPVMGVPVQSKTLNGVDSLYSIVQMPAGIPVATFAIGAPGAKNAALMALQILSLQDAALKRRLLDWRRAQTDAVAERPSNQEKK
jgi:5-(carboxyamino)imidazole ribonucleotide mutase